MAAGDGFTGNWTYRSFNNNPELDATADDLLVAMADMALTAGSDHGVSMGFDVGGVSAGLDLGGGSEISGKIVLGPGYDLIVSGAAKSGKSPTIRYRAVGFEGTPTAGWIYDYVGYLNPSWPNGVGQVPAIVGTVIRTVPHSDTDGQMRPAGVTLSFIAVSRDHPTGS